MNELEIIQLALVLFVALPSAVMRNSTAAALAASWLFSWIVWQLTYIGISVQVLLICNMAVIAAMFCKPPVGKSESIWNSLSPWDRAILTSYPVVWLLYTNLPTPQIQYWGLWFLFAAQVLLAGGDTLTLKLAQRKANASSEPVRRSNRPDLHWSLAGHGQ